MNNLRSVLSTVRVCGPKESAHLAHYCASVRDRAETYSHTRTLEDAQWYSFGANKHHGARRTNADKQAVIKAALTHPKSTGLSDMQIARHIGVSDHTVGDWRKKLDLSPKVSEIPATRTATRNGTTYQIDTGNIGRRVAMEARPEPPAVQESDAAPIQVDAPHIHGAAVVISTRPLSPSTLKNPHSAFTRKQQVSATQKHSSIGLLTQSHEATRSVAGRRSVIPSEPPQISSERTAYFVR